MNPDKFLHLIAGAGVFFSVSLSLDVFGGPALTREDAVPPAYFITLGVSAIKELDDEMRAPLRNDAKEHALDVGATMLGAVMVDVGVKFVRHVVSEVGQARSQSRVMPVSATRPASAHPTVPEEM